MPAPAAFGEHLHSLADPVLTALGYLGAPEPGSKVADVVHRIHS
jgi:hypothetical protein